MTDCIPWTGYVTPEGYGRTTKLQNGTRLAHRAAWIEANGPIPDGMTIDHICHDPSLCRLGSKCLHRRCINVDHLKVVPMITNISVERSRFWRHQAEKEKCPRGHLYDRQYQGARYCRICKNKQSFKSRHRDDH